MDQRVTKFLGLAPCLTSKYLTRVKVRDSEIHSSLLGNTINYVHEKFYVTDPRGQCCKDSKNFLK